MKHIKDFAVVLLILLLLAVGFYAMWVLVLLLVGVVIYFSIPIVKNISNRRPKSWK